MLSLQSYVNQSRHTLRKWSMDPGVHRWLKAAAHILAGFCLSAASLGHFAQPLCLGLVCALRGWPAVLAAAGSCLGYSIFWDSSGLQGLCWVALGLLTLLINLRGLSPGLQPAVSGLLVALTGLVFQLKGIDAVPVPIYLLRIGMAAGSTWMFVRVMGEKSPVSQWLTWFTAVLALAQIAPTPTLCLGFPLAGALMVAAPFPAAALAGLALDLAQVTPVPMTGVLTLGYMLRFFPRYPRWMGFIGAGCVFTAIMTLSGHWDLTPLPGFMVGGLLGSILPFGANAAIKRGPTGAAQVRLELVSGVLRQTQEILLSQTPPPVDEGELMVRAASRACAGCSNRGNCKDQRKLRLLTPGLLHQPLTAPEELPILCKKSGRFLAELHRSQEQLRSLQADRARQEEYRTAITEQYGFLSEYLQELSDQLPTREERNPAAFKPDVKVFGNKPEPDNGDRCMRFPGTGCRYYVLLCDGMGTGLGAIEESKAAGNMLRKLLTAGFPAQHALKSLNNLCALRERAGAVTVDLAELRLDTGRVVLYKWGAMPSYLVRTEGADRIGTPTPPPGLSVTSTQEQVHKLALKRGELLVLISDGGHDSDTLRKCMENKGRSPGDLGRTLMSHCRAVGDDDATTAIIRLLPI